MSQDKYNKKIAWKKTYFPLLHRKTYSPSVDFLATRRRRWESKLANQNAIQEEPRDKGLSRKTRALADAKEEAEY